MRLRVFNNTVSLSKIISLIWTLSFPTAKGSLRLSNTKRRLLQKMILVCWERSKKNFLKRALCLFNNSQIMGKIKNRRDRRCLMLMRSKRRLKRWGRRRGGLCQTALRSLGYLRSLIKISLGTFMSQVMVLNPAARSMSSLRCKNV